MITRSDLAIEMRYLGVRSIDMDALPVSVYGARAI